MIVTGFDIRNKSEGGDIHGRKNIKKGILELSKNAAKSGKGIHIAHLYGPGLGDIDAVAGGEGDKFSSIYSPDISLTLRGERKRAITLDGFYTEDQRLFKSSGRNSGELTVTAVLGGTENLKSGGQITDISKKVRDEALENLKTNFGEVYPKLFTPKGYLNLSDYIGDKYIELFKTSKITVITHRKQDKKSKKLEIKDPIYSFSVLPTKIKGFKGKKTVDVDLNSKIPYLNRRLHDKIQQNMGRGKSKHILNYQTGRFAENVEILSFSASREKRAVNARVKYMKDPYRVFEPGGSHLATPGRDPNRIIRRSIRQLLQEEKIANLRRVKVQLRG
jgi:hypothetical protein